MPTYFYTSSTNQIINVGCARHNGVTYLKQVMLVK
jgi:hypothetical protein